MEGLVRDVERALSVRVEQHEVLAGGEFNLSVLLRCGGERLVARRPRFEQEWRATLLGQAGAIERARDQGVPVPETVYVDETVLVHRYVEGHAMTEEEAAGGLAAEAGELLAAMHAVIGAGCGPVQPDGSSPGWSCATHFEPVGGEVERLLRTFDPAWGIERTDIETARRLLSSPPELRPRLVHGDAGPGNLVVHRDVIAAVIDFDNTWYGDPAIDLAWWWWRSPATVDACAAGAAAAGDHSDQHRTWACRVRLLIGLADIFAARMPERAGYIGQLLPQANAGLAKALT